MCRSPVQGLAVGFFDGVHLGHREILRGASAVLTFRNHPLTVLAPERAPRLIMSADERLRQLKACGIGGVTLLDFTPSFASMSPDEFLAFLATRHPRGLPTIRCGENWRFGKGGAGDADFLRRRGIAVSVAASAVHRGERISSSRIRAAIERGEIEEANAMLGRSFSVRGRRIGGKGLGRNIGYPTINLELDISAAADRVRLPCGVYEVALGGKRGIANYGHAPTLGAEAWGQPVFEVHLLDDCSPDDCRGEVCEVALVRHIRPERKFPSLAALKQQIAADCASVLQQSRQCGHPYTREVC